MGFRFRSRGMFTIGCSRENGEGHAIFMFKFEEEEEIEEEGNCSGKEVSGERNLMNMWTAQQNWNFGLNNEFWGKTGKSFSSSSVSVSSSAGSIGGSSSVLEWSSVEENELVAPIGFSLLVYAWKR